MGLLAGFVIAWLASKARNALARTAPEGYEDEQGFHFGGPFEQ
jgi:hypothetical protein